MRPKENGLNVRDELLKFHQNWYSSNIMALAILGRGKQSLQLFFVMYKNLFVIESLDELEEMVIKLFGEVQDKQVNAPKWEEHPFKKEQFKTCAYMIPIKDVRNLNIIFPAPDLHQYYKSAVSTYK